MSPQAPSDPPSSPDRDPTPPDDTIGPNLDVKGPEELVALLPEAEAWLKAIGFRTPDRVRHYMRIIREAESHRKAGKIHQFLEATDGTQFVDAWTEMGQFVEALPALRMWHSRQPDIVEAKLKIVLGGPTQVSLENANSSEPRNTFFEIWLGAKLQHGGPSVTLGDPDLTCHMKAGTIFLECKRAFSSKSIGNLIADGASQVGRKLDAKGGDARGGVAISVARALNPGDRICVAPNLEAAYEALNKDLHALVKEIEGELLRITDPRIICVLFHVAIPVEIAERTLYSLTFARLVSWPRVSDHDAVLLHETASAWGIRYPPAQEPPEPNRSPESSPAD